MPSSVVIQTDWHRCLLVHAYHAFCHVPVQLDESSQRRLASSPFNLEEAGQIAHCAHCSRTELCLAGPPTYNPLAAYIIYCVSSPCREIPCLHSCRYRFAKS